MAMTRRGQLLLGGSVVAGLLLWAVLLVYFRTGGSSTPVAPERPLLGGQAVPEKRFEIEFDRLYDVYCSFRAGEPTIFRGCTILGFTGEEPRSSRGGSGFGSGFSGSSGSGSASSYSHYFDQWLVLELADGRRAYIPPTAVEYIETAEAVGEDGNGKGEGDGT